MKKESRGPSNVTLRSWRFRDLKDLQNGDATQAKTNEALEVYLKAERLKALAAKQPNKY